MIKCLNNTKPRQMQKMNFEIVYNFTIL
jgi:hypothetical protein